MKILDYSKALISDDDREANIKHFIIFMTAIHYFLASFMILFGVVRYTVDKDMMYQIMENDFYIICVGVGVLTFDNAMQAFASRASVVSSIFTKKKKDPEVSLDQASGIDKTVINPEVTSTSTKTD